MTTPTPSSDAGPGRLITTLVIAAIVLTVGAIVTGFVIAARVSAQADAPDTGPLAVPAAPMPGGGGHFCTELLAQLPDSLDDSPRRELIASDPGVAAWGDPAVVLRCGLSDPAELTCSAALMRFTGATGIAVEWLRTAAGSSVTFLAVDRPVRIAVTVPDSAGITPIQELSDVIGSVLPSQPVCTDGTLTATDNS